MKFLRTFLLLLVTQHTFAQNIFTVDDLSKDFYGKISIDDASAVFSPGWVAIYERRSHKEIIKITSDELALLLPEGKVISPNMSLPYGEQRLIIHEDFNFDGKKDLAIEDGQNSCYHGPSFQVYLATDKGFVFNSDFTRLAQDYCGLFGVDNKTKTISVSTKDGCCWHEFSQFKVINNKPRAIKIITENAIGASPLIAITEQTWNGKTMITKKMVQLYTEGIDTIFSFIVPENGKRVLLFSSEQQLYYALLRKDGTVEFSFPDLTADPVGSFTFYPQERRRIVFRNKNATYTVYETAGNIGIDITTGGKTYHWAGEMETRKGSLYKYTTMGFSNVIMP